MVNRLEGDSSLSRLRDVLEEAKPDRAPSADGPPDWGNDLREVTRSQSIMLQRRGTKGAKLTDEQLIKAYENQLARVEAWLAERPNFRVLYVSYNRLVAEPAPAAAEVNAFLGGGLNEEAMVKHVEPQLYRQRA